jgi:hypothetical protein
VAWCGMAMCDVVHHQAEREMALSAHSRKMAQQEALKASWAEQKAEAEAIKNSGQKQRNW